MSEIKELFKEHMKDPEFAKAVFKEDLAMAITEAVCEVLNSYGFKQSDREGVAMREFTDEELRQAYETIREWGIHETMVNSNPKLQRGMVWCVVCGRSQTVDSAHCLRYGWPECCGYTMTIDAPEERKAAGREG